MTDISKVRNDQPSFVLLNELRSFLISYLDPKSEIKFYNTKLKVDDISLDPNWKKALTEIRRHKNDGFYFEYTNYSESTKIERIVIGKSIFEKSDAEININKNLSIKEYLKIVEAFDLIFECRPSRLYNFLNSFYAPLLLILFAFVVQNLILFYFIYKIVPNINNLILFAVLIISMILVGNFATRIVKYFTPDKYIYLVNFDDKTDVYGKNYQNPIVQWLKNSIGGIIAGVIITIIGGVVLFFVQDWLSIL